MGLRRKVTFTKKITARKMLCLCDVFEPEKLNGNQIKTYRQNWMGRPRQVVGHTKGSSAYYDFKGHIQNQEKKFVMEWFTGQFLLTGVD